MSYLARGHADTEAQKRAIVERLLAAWLRKPNQRFGQLLENVAAKADRDLFYIKDDELVNLVDEFTEAR